MNDQEDEEHYLWPDTPRPPFGPGDPWDHGLNAEVRYVQSRKNFHAYLEGYRRAAIKLFKSACDEGRGANYYVWPLAFLWRHHIELSLKAVIGSGRALDLRRATFPHGHRLVALWREALPHIIACGSADSPELPNVQSTLEDFERLDPGSDGFRYPLARDGVNASLQDPPHTINLRTLHQSMGAVAQFLTCVRTEMTVRLDSLMETYAAQAEWRDYYEEEDWEEGPPSD
jgi:hypothetical protein